MPRLDHTMLALCFTFLLMLMLMTGFLGRTQRTEDANGNPAIAINEDTLSKRCLDAARC